MAMTIISPSGQKMNVTNVSGQGAADINITQSIPISTIAAVPPTTVLAGDKTVAIAGTAEALAVSTTSVSVTVQAKVANTNDVFVGNATTQDATLTPGDSVVIDIDDLDKVFIDVTTNGEGVNFVGEA